MSECSFNPGGAKQAFADLADANDAFEQAREGRNAQRRRAAETLRPLIGRQVVMTGTVVDKRVASRLEQQPDGTERVVSAPVYSRPQGHNALRDLSGAVYIVDITAAGPWVSEEMPPIEEHLVAIDSITEVSGVCFPTAIDD